MAAPSLIVFALALSVAATPVFAKGPPKPLADWPCETPLTGPLDMEVLWPGAGASQPAEGAWEQDQVAHKLVNFLTAGENSPAIGQREIEEFAQRNGKLRHETAILVVSGMVERANKLRLILLHGIKQQIIKSHVLAEAVDGDAGKIDAVERQPSEEAQKQVTALKEARRQNLAQLDDTNEMAEHLCHRLVYDETKLRRLTDTLKANTQDN
jgi:hypothetical protein